MRSFNALLIGAVLSLAAAGSAAGQTCGFCRNEWVASHWVHYFEVNPPPLPNYDDMFAHYDWVDGVCFSA